MSAADVEQGTEAWRLARCGFVTASRICDVLRKPKRGQKESTTRKAYMAQIVAERLTGRPQEDQFESWDTRRGIQLEPFARDEYELRSDQQVQTVGFVIHPSIPFAGCSPDGYVGDAGLFQIKCPRTYVQLDYWQNQIVPVEYRPQMLWELACTGRKWSDFVAYNRELPDYLQLFVKRLVRDDAEIAAIEEEVRRFNAEVDAIISRLPKADGNDNLEHLLERSIAQVGAKQ